MESICILCGKSTNQIILPKSNILYYRCSNCDLLYKDRTMILSKEQEHQRYLLHNNSIHDSKYYQFLYQFFHNYVLPYIQKDDIGLDYGSGPNPVLSEIVKKEYSIELGSYDPLFNNQMNVFSAKYDYITSTEVFEHFDELKSEIEKVLSILKPDGILAIMTLIHPDDDENIKNWYYIRDETHISIFGKKTIDYMVDHFGLELIATDDNRNFTFRKKAKQT